MMLHGNIQLRFYQFGRVNFKQLFGSKLESHTPKICYSSYFVPSQAFVSDKKD